ncbi:hypothetical protein E4U41_004708, partial [Claviceps citrina]
VLDVDVDVRRLSDLLRQTPGFAASPRVDLLKIDVEGAEMDVLRGVDDEHWPLVRNVVLEIGDDHAEAAALLEGKGFVVVTERAAWAPEDLNVYMIKAGRKA